MNLEGMTSYLDSLVDSRDIPSVDCIVYKDHQVIYRHMKGTTDEEKTLPMNGSEYYLLFSMTKVTTMTAIMQLIEQGKLSLEDKVSKYLPAYADYQILQNEKPVKNKVPMLIKHLVSMQSGLDYDLERPGIKRVLAEKGMKATTTELVNAFPESPLLFAPGDHFQYSLSHDVAAAIIEVVTGMSFGEYLRQNIFEPLHMDKTFFAKPMNEDLEGLSAQFIANDQGKIVLMEKSCCYQLSESYESGGAGLVSCTEDYALLGEALSCGGVSKDGVRILKPETIDVMRTNLLDTASLWDFQHGMGRIGYGYGCGVQVLMHPEQLGSKAPAGIFGWDGAAGSCLIIDPINRLSLVYTQHVRNCGVAYSEFHHKLRDFLYE